MTFADFWGVCGYVPPGADGDHIYEAMKCAWNAAIEEAAQICEDWHQSRNAQTAVAIRKLAASDAVSHDSQKDKE